MVRAWVSMNIDGAREAADASTSRYRENRPVSTIDGMPIGVKDLYATRDMPTKMGSPLFEKNSAPRHCKRTGAAFRRRHLILGKTVTTELGMSHPGPTRRTLLHPRRSPRRLFERLCRRHQRPDGTRGVGLCNRQLMHSSRRILCKLRLEADHGRYPSQ